MTGVVTIDGKPEPELLVIYEPQIPKGTNPTGGTAGGPSSGMTDSEGMFELVYRDGKRKGAVVGPHLVRITSAKGGGGAGGETGETQLGIPARYNFKTKLTADVTEGENEPKTYELVIGEPSQKKQK